MTKFKTKIVQRSEVGHDYHELLLPNGECVASGSLTHCWDERERWEEVLKMDMAEYNEKCQRDYYRRHPEALQLTLKFSD